MPKIVDEQMREATRQHILREAAHEFARLGFDQANINLIAEQACIGKGTIYLYFLRCYEQLHKSNLPAFDPLLLLKDL